MPERSKGDDLRSSVFVLVGSNPTQFKYVCDIFEINLVKKTWNILSINY